MRRGDGVAVVEMHADADARRLLAGIEMHEARNVAGGEFLVHRVLEFADQRACAGRRQEVRRARAAARSPWASSSSRFRSVGDDDAARSELGKRRAFPSPLRGGVRGGVATALCIDTPHPTLSPQGGEGCATSTSLSRVISPHAPHPRQRHGHVELAAAKTRSPCSPRARPPRRARRHRRGRSSRRARRAPAREKCPAPVRTPPSNSTSVSPPTASAISGSAEIDDGAPSSWRPPWFDTTIASAPASTASRASSGVEHALDDELSRPEALDPFDVAPGERLVELRHRPFRELAHALRARQMPGEIAEGPALAAQHADEPRQLHRHAEKVRQLKRGGTERPFRASQCRSPSTCRSTVSTSALQPGGARPLDAARGQNRGPSSHRAGTRTAFCTAAATSSIERIDKVESVKGMPASSAARHARISPFAALHARATPPAPAPAAAPAVRPRSVVERSRFETSTITRCRMPDFLQIRAVRASACSSEYDPAST